MFSLPIAERTCGSCSACCTLSAVLEVDKPNHTDCIHQDKDNPDGGCKIYATRPDVCRKWKCEWLHGFIEGDERRRPDKLGLMFTDFKLGNEVILSAWEVWAGASQQHQFLLDKLAKTYKLLVITAPPRRGGFMWQTGTVIAVPFFDRV